LAPATGLSVIATWRCRSDDRCTFSSCTHCLTAAETDVASSHDDDDASDDDDDDDDEFCTTSKEVMQSSPLSLYPVPSFLRARVRSWLPSFRITNSLSLLFVQPR